MSEADHNDQNKWRIFTQQMKNSEDSTEEMSVHHPEPAAENQAAASNHAEVTEGPQAEQESSAHPQNESTISTGVMLALQKQVESYKEQLFRAQADFQNYKQLMNREKESLRKYAIEKLLLQLLPVIDSLRRGLLAAKSAENFAAQKSLYEGMQLTLNLFEKVLMEFGVQSIQPEIGSPFDPHFHEAMALQNNAELPSDCVAAVLESGYELQGRVIRAAKVMVNKTSA